jgi:NB-ARC domain
MSSKSNKDEYTQIEWVSKFSQIDNKQNSWFTKTVEVLNDFDFYNWCAFIQDLSIESKTIERVIIITDDDEPILYFVNLFRSLDLKNIEKIENAILFLLEPLVQEENKLPEDALKKYRNILFIAYSLPASNSIKLLNLLKQLSTNDKLDDDLRYSTLSTLVGIDILNKELDINWWIELLKTRTTKPEIFEPIAITSLITQEQISLSSLLEFFNRLNEPIYEDIERYRVIIYNLLNRFLDEYDQNKYNGNASFKLSLFPVWTHQTLIDLLQLNKFATLQDAALNSKDCIQEYVDCLSNLFPDIQETFSNLPDINGKYYKDLDKRINLVKQKLFKDRKQILFVVGSEIYGAKGVGKTNLVLQAARHFTSEKFEKEPYSIKFEFIIFIDANVDGFNAILNVISDTVGNELIKRIKPEYQEDKAVSILTQKSSLLIIDDFHKQSKEERDRIVSFIEKIGKIGKIGKSCKIIITTGFSNETDCFSKSNILDRIDHIELSRKSEDFWKNLASETASKYHIDSEFTEQIYSLYHGVPLAVTFALALKADAIDRNISIDADTYEKMKEVKDSVRAAYNSSIKYIGKLNLEKPTKILQFIANFKGSINRASLLEILGKMFDSNITEIDNAIKILTDLRLVSFVSYNGIFNDDLLNIEIQESIREYVLDDSTEGTEYKDVVYSELTKYYTYFTDKYGGADWDDWSKFNYLSREWNNILSILNWNNEKGNYENIKIIWFQVNRFADLRGYWSDRQKWLDIIIKNYEGSNDKHTYVRALISKAWTLIMLGDADKRYYKEAGELLGKAEQFKDNPDVIPVTRSYLAHNITILSYKEKNLILADSNLLDQFKIYKTLESYLNNPGHNFSKFELPRHEINYLRNKAKLYSKNGKYQDALSTYNSCLDKSTKIKWMRMVSYCYCMLAEVNLSIDESNNSERGMSSRKNLEDACICLYKGMQIAITNNSKRRVAGFEKVLSRIYKQIGNENKSYKWLDKSKKDYENLGIMY